MFVKLLAIFDPPTWTDPRRHVNHSTGEELKHDDAKAKEGGGVIRKQRLSRLKIVMD